MARNRRRGAKVAGPRQNGRNPTRGNPGSRREMIPHPPPIRDFGLSYSGTLRFTVVADIATPGISISYADLTDCYVLCTSAVTGIKLFPYVKVRYVEMWDDAPVGTPATVTCTFDETDANQADPPITKTDTSIGLSPAHIRMVPRKDSLTSKWHGTSGNNAFIVYATAGAIIDVGVSMRTTTQSASVIAVQNALVAATLGVIYHRGLDGLAIATTNFLPPVGCIRI